MPSSEKKSKWQKDKELKELQAQKDQRLQDDDKKITAHERQQQLIDESKLQRANQPKYARTDPRFKEIREELARRSRRKQDDENIVEE